MPELSGACCGITISMSLDYKQVQGRLAKLGNVFEKLYYSNSDISLETGKHRTKWVDQRSSYVT